MTIARTTLLLLCALAAPAAAQQPITPADYGKWESLGGGTLSPDGEWFAYSVNRVNEKSELRIRGGARDTTIVAPFGSGATFSADGRWLAYTIGIAPEERERKTAAEEPIRNDVGIVDLTRGTRAVVDDIASFAFSADGRYLVLRGYPAEGKRVATLLVRDLARGTQVAFGDVAESEWADAGALLALTVETESGAGNAVQLFDAATGSLRVLDGTTARYRGLAWRADAADLAVLRTRVDSAYRDTAHVVLAWRRLATTAPAAFTLDAGATGLPDTLGVASARSPEWSEDGATVFVGVRPRERKPARDTARAEANEARDSTAGRDSTMTDTTRSPTGVRDSAGAASDPRSDVQVWHARDVRIMPMQKAQEEQDLRRTLLAAWHLTDGRVVRIGTDLLETARVLEGGRYATETDRSAYAFGTMFGRPATDVWVIDVATGERRKALEDVRYFLGESATGARLVWWDGTDYWTQDVRTGARTNLTAQVDADFANRDYDYPVDILPARGNAGWTEGDGAFLVYDEYDVWSLAPDGSGGRRLTNGAADGVVHRYVGVRDDEDGIDLARPVYLSLSGKKSKQTGYARMLPGRAPERLVLEDARVIRLQRADSADVFAFTRERFDDSPDWFLGGATLADAQQISETNPFQSDYAWGRAALVDFTSEAGEALQAVLLYPAGYDATRSYPMIVYTYELLSQNVHNYVVPTERSYYNFNAWTANGYFVLMPDIVYRGREPGESALDAVEPAVRTALGEANIDAARVGLIGHSWGGYQATYLPTRTNIFAAAVAGAPITNFLSFAGAIHWTPGIAEMDHWETGQARMGVPYWEDFDAYLRNSPAHKVHELDTPMLMMFGDADGTVDWHQGIEFYNFARRAGKDDFVMLVYPGEDHGLRKKENQIDYHRRILQWFGHWLKGEPAPDWMTQGVSWLDRRALLNGGR
jgi:dipeptidyl aminopeptidase/acylaminoacyl peptidase